MNYKTHYKESYARGSRNLSITISATALDAMMQKEIDNYSAFINDLILEGLHGSQNFFVREKLKTMNAIKEELEKEGYFVEIQMQKTLSQRGPE